MVHECTERCRCPDGSCAIEHANGGNMSLREVAVVFGVRWQTVRDWEIRALRRFERAAGGRLREFCE